MKSIGNGTKIAAGCLFALAVAASLVCGCVLASRRAANERIAGLVRSAYANGGAASVSNRIERLAADGAITAKQAERLHRLAQKVYDGVVDRLEDEVAEADLEEAR